MKKYLLEIIVVLLFVLSRIPSLGHDNFTTDTWKWKSRSYDFGTGVFTLDFEKTLQKYHPGVTLMWIGTAGVKIYNLSFNLLHGTDPLDNDIRTVFELDFAQKLITVLVIGIVLAFCLYPVRRMFGGFQAAVTGLLVALEPYFLALSRVFHLEGLLSIFLLASVMWLFWYLKERGTGRLVISAIFGGLAILTKTTALFLLPFGILMFILWGLSDENWAGKALGVFSKSGRRLLSLKNLFLPLTKWFLIICATIFLLWPALWVNPAEVYKAIYKGVAVVGIEREHIQYYFGKLVEDPGPSFYPVVFLLKSSIALILGLLGTLLILRKLSKEKKQFVLYMITFSLLYMLALSFPTKKLDRYIVPAIVSLSAVSSFFYVWLLDKFRVSNFIKGLTISIILIISVVYLHPDYLSYYNPITGGLKRGIDVLEPKWLIGERELVSYFNNIMDSGKYEKSYNSSIEEIIDSDKAGNFLIVALQEKYYTQIWPFFREKGMWPVIEDLSGQSRYAQYFIYPVWDDASSVEKRFKLAYDGSVYLRGTEVYRVYRKVEK